MNKEQVKRFGKYFAVTALILLAASFESIINLTLLGFGL